MHRALSGGWCLPCGHRLPHHGGRGKTREDPGNRSLPASSAWGAWTPGLPESESHQLGKGCVWRD